MTGSTRLLNDVDSSEITFAVIIAELMTSLSKELLTLNIIVIISMSQSYCLQRDSKTTSLLHC